MRTIALLLICAALYAAPVPSAPINQPEPPAISGGQELDASDVILIAIVLWASWAGLFNKSV